MAVANSLGALFGGFAQGAQTGMQLSQQRAQMEMQRAAQARQDKMFEFEKKQAEVQQQAAAARAKREQAGRFFKILEAPKNRRKAMLKFWAAAEDLGKDNPLVKNLTQIMDATDPEELAAFGSMLKDMGYAEPQKLVTVLGQISDSPTEWFDLLAKLPKPGELEASKLKPEQLKAQIDASRASAQSSRASADANTALADTRRAEQKAQEETQALVRNRLGGGQQAPGVTQYRPLQGGERRDNGDGTFSSELEVTERLPDGSWVNVPSLWMGPNGMEEVAADRAVQIALDYEKRTGQKFPRFKTVDEGIAAAKARSNAGGTSVGPLARGRAPSDPGDAFIALARDLASVDPKLANQYASLGKTLKGDQRSQKIKELTGRGIPLNKAQDIADGRYRLSSPDEFGNVMLINIADPTDMTVLRPTANGDFDTSASGKVNVGNPAAIEGKILDGGVGPWSNLKAMFNEGVGGLLGVEFFPESAENRRYLRTFAQFAKASLVNNPKFPVAEQQIVAKLLPDPDTFFKNPQSDAKGMVQLRDTLRRLRNENTKSIRSGGITQKEAGVLANKNAEINRILAMMGDPVPGAKYNPHRPTNSEEFSQVPPGHYYIDSSGELARRGKTKTSPPKPGTRLRFDAQGKLIQ